MEGFGFVAPAGLMEILSWLLFIIFIAGLVVVGGLLLRGYLTTGSPASALAGTFFAPKPEKRLEVTDQAALDGRRRLVLVRRDNVEHLIMTGGPVDVVIETNIGADAHTSPTAARTTPVDTARVLPSRPSEKLDKAVGE